MNPTKVLFLDIDGVINSERTVEASGGYPHSFLDHDMSRFDPIAVKLIQKLLRDTGSVVVVSSTWRMHYSCEEIAKGLDIPVLDRTPSFGRIRGDEVKKWLDLYTDKHNVTKYAIVDDNSDFLEEQKPFFVQTDAFNGLMFQDYDRLFKLLSDHEEEDLLLDYPPGVKYGGITVTVEDKKEEIDTEK